MKMKSFSGSQKTNPNKANPSTWLRACPEVVEGAGFKRGGYAALRSAYKKTLFSALDLIEWTLGDVGKSKIKNQSAK
jgi:hypothetical protein